MFTLNITKPNLDPYSKRQWNADVYCACCGRGIPNRHTTQVAIRKWVPGSPEGQQNFLKIADHAELGYDPVSWGVYIGSHCAKQLPKEYKISHRRCMTAWIKAGQPNS